MCPVSDSTWNALFPSRNNVTSCDVKSASSFGAIGAGCLLSNYVRWEMLFNEREYEMKMAEIFKNMYAVLSCLIIRINKSMYKNVHFISF